MCTAFQHDLVGVLAFTHTCSGCGLCFLFLIIITFFPGPRVCWVDNVAMKIYWCDQSNQAVSDSESCLSSTSSIDIPLLLHNDKVYSYPIKLIACVNDIFFLLRSPPLNYGPESSQHVQTQNYSFYPKYSWNLVPISDQCLDDLVRL